MKINCELFNKITVLSFISWVLSAEWFHLIAFAIQVEWIVKAIHRCKSSFGILSCVCVFILHMPWVASMSSLGFGNHALLFNVLEIPLWYHLWHTRTNNQIKDRAPCFLFLFIHYISVRRSMERTWRNKRAWCAFEIVYVQCSVEKQPPSRESQPIFLSHKKCIIFFLRLNSF